jgi:hypothetical protein
MKTRSHSTAAPAAPKVAKKQTQKPAAMATTARDIRLRSRGKISNIVFEVKSNLLVLNKTLVQITVIVLTEKTKFKRMMKSFAKRLRMGVEMMNFSFKGRAIDPESTASDLDIRDNNVVEVKPSQLLLSKCANK